jgi:hypothetical protein
MARTRFERRTLEMENRRNVVAIAGIIAGTIILLACIASTTVIVNTLLQEVF